MPAERAFSSLYVEPVGGVAGDMLLAALLDLGADPAAIQRVYDSTGLPGLRLQVSHVDVGGVRACYVRSLERGASLGGASPRVNGHPSCHAHLKDVLDTVDRAVMSPRARSRARQIFSILACAEAEVHGGTPQTVHLHEVGDLDAVLDVVGISVAMDSLGNPRATCGPLPSGCGSVRTAHGELACPVPAVVAIASKYRVPLVPVPVSGETITPTGIAALAAICDGFEKRPADDSVRVGVGAGTRRFEDRPNVVRVEGSERGASSSKEGGEQ